MKAGWGGKSFSWGIKMNKFITKMYDFVKTILQSGLGEIYHYINI